MGVYINKQFEDFKTSFCTMAPRSTLQKDRDPFQLGSMSLRRIQGRNIRTRTSENLFPISQSHSGLGGELQYLSIVAETVLESTNQS